MSSNLKASKLSLIRSDVRVIYFHCCAVLRNLKYLSGLTLEIVRPPILAERPSHIFLGSRLVVTQCIVLALSVLAIPLNRVVRETRISDLNVSVTN